MSVNMQFSEFISCGMIDQVNSSIGEMIRRRMYRGRRLAVGRREHTADV
jgi:hypothetical protein